MDDATGTGDPYRIGVVGVGHWATRFDRAMDGDLSFYSAADVAPMDDKEDTLDALGIPASRYHRIAPDDPLPEAFLRDLDVVHVASPIAAHRDQTTQALEDTDALVVTEKAYGPSLDDHDAVQEVAEREGNDAYLHLHYTRKMPTLAMRDTVRDAVAEYGPVQDVQMSFLERFDETDVERSWVFDPANGGIVLDWIHPMEVLVYACDAEFSGLTEASGVRTTDAYGVDHPTAAALTYDVDGELFADDVTASIRLGKGFDRTHKAARLDFGDATLDFSYANSGAERGGDDRGAVIRDGPDAYREERLSGPTPYELMADDMAHAVETGEPPFTLDAAREMMSAVEMANDRLFADDAVTLEVDAVVDRMVDDALANTWTEPVASR